ncbi:MAG: hypothetical protein CSA18_03345 [Deltaproteobacteria bacterium]|nr:MAG: hypothetical protein CSA18_03345 [Deltaproteobacteria bacterium]
MKNNDSGFTLIEVMIALLVFMVGVMGVLGMQAIAIKDTANASSLKNAVFVGETFAEKTRLKTFDNINSVANQPEGIYTIKSTVTPSSDSKYKTVDVDVKWAKNGINHVYEFSFIVVNPNDI